MNFGTNERKGTLIDEGWRTITSPSGCKATEVEEGWREQGGNSGRKSTEVDEGWRNTAENISDPVNIIQEAENNGETASLKHVFLV